MRSKLIKVKQWTQLSASVSTFHFYWMLWVSSLMILPLSSILLFHYKIYCIKTLYCIQVLSSSWLSQQEIASTYLLGDFTNWFDVISIIYLSIHVSFYSIATYFYCFILSYYSLPNKFIYLISEYDYCRLFPKPHKTLITGKQKLLKELERTMQLNNHQIDQIKYNFWYIIV